MTRAARQGLAVWGLLRGNSKFPSTTSQLLSAPRLYHSSHAQTLYTLRFLATPGLLLPVSARSFLRHSSTDSAAASSEDSSEEASSSEVDLSADSSSPAAIAPTGPIFDRHAYLLRYTCTQCGHKSNHFVTSEAYHCGTSVVRCPIPDCHDRHVISDHLKLIEDQSLNFETIAEKDGAIKRDKNSVEFLTGL